ncbi:MAG: hypothetical protein ACFFAO_16450 [Candidatus Hermodarchaeota archaeon]
MSTATNSINIEEVIFYIDLTTEIIKKKTLIRIIHDFIKNKKKISDSSFGIVLFQEEDNPVWLYDEKDANLITKIIDEKWDNRPKNQSYIENGLFEILSYIFRKSREIEKNYRILVVSDTASTRSEEYHNALYDLIVKSKKFSTIIDIIRINTQSDYVDEVKLKVISSETQGGMFICNDVNQFEDIISSLIKSKKEFNIIQPTDESREYLEEDKDFYERLAVDLISLDPDDEEICDICQFELCPICSAYSDEIHKCYNCGTRFHSCCISKYSITNNIGYKHIFRCPKCQNLLKLDEEYVNLVFEEEFEGQAGLETKYGPKEEVYQSEQEQYEPEAPIEQIDEVVEASEHEIQDYEIDEHFEQEQIIEETSVEVKMVPVPPPPKSPAVKKVRIGGYFGQEIEVSKIKKNSKPIKVIESTTTTLEQNVSITKLRPPKKRSSVKFCKICGASVQHVVNCPNCGAKID